MFIADNRVLLPTFNYQRKRFISAILTCHFRFWIVDLRLPDD
jgi:hypothetical protein